MAITYVVKGVSVHFIRRQSSLEMLGLDCHLDAAVSACLCQTVKYDKKFLVFYADPARHGDRVAGYSAEQAWR